MKKVVLASNNKHKIEEIKMIFNDVEILTLKDIDYNDEIEESGSTFLENALIKAKTVKKYLIEKGLDYPVLADDSGLCCEAIDLAPGVYSARYAGVHDDSAANRAKLLKELKDKKRKAYFTCTLVYLEDMNSYIYKEGKTYGTIIDDERGKKDFGYDCIFLSDDLGVTFGEASEEAKNKVSHRFRALKGLKEELKKRS